MLGVLIFNNDLFVYKPFDIVYYNWYYAFKNLPGNTNPPRTEVVIKTMSKGDKQISLLTYAPEEFDAIFMDLEYYEPYSTIFREE